MARTTIWGAALAAVALTRGVLATDILKTSGFTNCEAGSSIQVNNVNIEYDKTSETVTFDVSGTSTQEQKVMASLNVTAYGIEVYSNTFDPCDNGTYVEQLCPVPAGGFSATGSQDISTTYANQIPAIAFQVPDIAATATLELIAIDTKQDVGCITSDISNGKTTNVAAVTYVAAAIAGVALVMGGVTAAGSALAGGAGAGAGAGAAPSPSFFEVFSWFQGMAMNGMSSASLPQVYRSFSKNFGFSIGLIPWAQMQMSIDDFREATGGNLTTDSVQFLKNATLVFSDGSTQDLSSSSKFKRAMDQFAYIASRGVTGSVNSTENAANSTTQSIESEVRIAVRGIKAYAEELSIPSANTFMTVLLIVSIVIASIAVIILLIKVILEAWALFASFPKSLTGFRKHYWFTMGRTITQLILILYGTWVLYCIFQFTNGDSWAAKTLAGVTLALFTGVLAFFAYKIFTTAKKLREANGDVSQLYENKDMWIRYSLFYENYKKDYWWIFVPTILYMFAKGCILAAGDTHGLAQTIGQLIVEALMLAVLVWHRPYERKSGNVINIMIAVVRVLSVICILVFVDEFAISETTTTVTGVVLIAIQAALTGILAILIIWNAMVSICNQNPHRKRRKEMEKLRDLDDLTPLDARNSLLLDRKSSHADSDTFSLAKAKFDVKESYDQDQAHNLVSHAAPPGGYEDRSVSPAPYADGSNMYARAPYNPQTGYGGGQSRYQ
ncbi:Flavin carrier protein 2 [Cytospora mali]|uniref:Flavin carrier protein 2 n=1 Tax=Cytospora mali TaxID=578113 RepID=A0A194VQD7_CYTMA|nr:Flavin carrier protein 2 [Valsa mali]